jgi:hypothetical protein
VEIKNVASWQFQVKRKGEGEEWRREKVLAV